MTSKKPMPKYRSHKIVCAHKIESFTASDGVNVDGFIPTEPGYEHIPLDKAYMSKHNPHPGGYYVLYDDGYKSFSPGPQFERGNTLINYDAIVALEAAKDFEEYRNLIGPVLDLLICRGDTHDQQNYSMEIRQIYKNNLETRWLAEHQPKQFEAQTEPALDRLITADEARDLAVMRDLDEVVNDVNREIMMAANNRLTSIELSHGVWQQYHNSQDDLYLAAKKVLEDNGYRVIINLNMTPGNAEQYSTTISWNKLPDEATDTIGVVAPVKAKDAQAWSRWGAGSVLADAYMRIRMASASHETSVKLDNSFWRMGPHRQPELYALVKKELFNQGFILMEDFREIRNGYHTTALIVDWSSETKAE